MTHSGINTGPGVDQTSTNPDLAVVIEEGLHLTAMREETRAPRYKGLMMRGGPRMAKQIQILEI